MTEHHHRNKKDIPNLSAEIITTHEDIVRMTAQEVLSQTIPWEVYQKADLVLERELDLIKKYDKKSPEDRAALFRKEGAVYAELFLELLIKITKEETLQYLLTLMDQLLVETPKAVTSFLDLRKKNKAFPFDPILRILNRSALDWFTYAKASTLLATFMSKSDDVPEESVKYFCNWIVEQLRKPEEKDACNAISALQRLVRNDQFRPIFGAEGDGLQLLGGLLKSKAKNFQILYQTICCLWLLTYNKTVAAQVADTKIIPNLVDILRMVSKEKVLRVSLATLRNLLGIGSNNELMIESSIMRPLELLSYKSWGDEDIVEDLETLKEALQKEYVHLSSFDMYKKEVLSGNLEWSPVHRSEKFWRENAHRLEEDNYKLLLVLKQLLSEKTEYQVQSIACFDLGEFARSHPRGKIILQQLNIKIQLMKLMEDKNPEVKKQALLAIQKLMVTNWEYLTH